MDDVRLNKAAVCCRGADRLPPVVDMDIEIWIWIRTSTSFVRWLGKIVTDTNHAAHLLWKPHPSHISYFHFSTSSPIKASSAKIPTHERNSAMAERSSFFAKREEGERFSSTPSRSPVTVSAFLSRLSRLPGDRTEADVSRRSSSPISLSSPQRPLEKRRCARESKAAACGETARSKECDRVQILPWDLLDSVFLLPRAMHFLTAVYTCTALLRLCRCYVQCWPIEVLYLVRP